MPLSGSVLLRGTIILATITAGALGGVAYPKLMWWDDPITLLTGIGGVMVLAGH